LHVVPLVEAWDYHRDREPGHARHHRHQPPTQTRLRSNPDRPHRWWCGTVAGRGVATPVDRVQTLSDRSSGRRENTRVYVLGLNQHHDAAAALVKDDQIVAFIEEERVTRVKHDGRFPGNAARACLEMAGITLGDVDHVAYFWQARKELAHAVRHFVTHLPDTLAVFRNDGGNYTDRAQGLVSTLRSGGSQSHPDDYHVGGALLLHLRRSFSIGRMLKEALDYQGPTKFKVHLIDHHYAHAASAYFLSPFDRAAIITWDGIGSDGTSTYLAVGEGDRIRDVRRVKFPHSLGAMYACVTGYLGFHPARDEGKVMGLAAYGRPTYLEEMRQLVRLLPEGRYELDLSWFRHHATGKHQMSQKFIDRFGP